MKLKSDGRIGMNFGVHTSERTSLMKSVRFETMETLPELYEIFQGEVCIVTA